MRPGTKIQRVVLPAVVGVAVAAFMSSASAQEPLRWKFEVGDRLNYNAVQDMTIDVEGGPIGKLTMATQQQMDMTWEVVEVNDDGEAKIRQKVDRVRVKMTGLGGQGYEYDSDSEEPPVGNAAMAAPMFEAMTEGDFELTLTARGELKDVTVPEAVLTTFKNSPQAAQMGELVTPEAIQKMIMQDVVVLPETAPAEGESWSTKTEIAIPAAGKQTVETTYTYQGTKEVEGAQYAVIRAQRQIDFAKAENQQLQMDIEGQSSDGEVLFNVEAGRLSTLALDQSLTMEATAQGQTMQQKMDQKVKVEVTPAEEENSEVEAAPAD